MISLKDTRELIIHCHEVGIHGTNLFDVFNTNIDKKSFVGNLNHYRTKKKKKFHVQKIQKQYIEGNSQGPGLADLHSYTLHFPLSLIEDGHTSSVKYPSTSVSKQLTLQLTKLQQWFYWGRQKPVAQNKKQGCVSMFSYVCFLGDG